MVLKMNAASHDVVRKLENDLSEVHVGYVFDKDGVKT